jgi:exodeoxyribonuclease VII large subunit
MQLADITMSVSEFVSLVNQTFDYAFPGIVVSGELANLRISKNKWLYFDLKDDGATVKCFGTVFQLPGPLEDGILLQVRGTPRLHNQYGFSFNVQSIRPAGEGSIRKAANLLQTQLAAEGIFDQERKRPLPYPPQRIALVASKQSAAYADFVKIINARWAGLSIEHIDVQVQGEIAPAQIASAIEQFNSTLKPPDVLVLIRGGGSTEDLAAFSTEQVTRAVSSSRIPTLVAVGHEIDLSLAELAADRRASTPSNAAELLVPDRLQQREYLLLQRQQLDRLLSQIVMLQRAKLQQSFDDINNAWSMISSQTNQQLKLKQQLLAAFNPNDALRRGYAIIRSEKTLLTSVKQLHRDQLIRISLHDGIADAMVKNSSDSVIA